MCRTSETPRRRRTGWPLASYRNASFMQNEVPGVEIESVARVRDRVAGIQVSAPLGKIATALAVVEEG